MRTRSLTGITWTHTRDYLRDGGDPIRTLAELNRHYRESRADEGA